MADWVHCNSCFCQPCAEKKFALTSCCHIFCENCITPETSRKCQMCGMACTTITLSSKMKPDVELFFTDPKEIVKKQQKQLLQVIEFQQIHRQRLASYNREKMAKQTNMMQKAQKAIKQSQDLEREVMILKQENAYMKALIRRGGGTPGGSTSTARTPPASRMMSPVSYHGNTPPSSAHRHSGSPSPSQSSKYHSYHKPARSLPGGTTTPLRTNLVAAGRLNILTPPSRGRIGVVPESPSPGGAVYSQSVKFASSPAGGMSPMQCSPAPRSGMQFPASISMPITPKTPGGTLIPPPSSAHRQVSRSTPTYSSSQSLESGDQRRLEAEPRRMIQVNHPPRPSFRVS